jgi:hypothetical protein
LIDYALWLVGKRRRENGRMRIMEVDDEDEEHELKAIEEEKQDDDDEVEFLFA